MDNTVGWPLSYGLSPERDFCDDTSVYILLFWFVFFFFSVFAQSDGNASAADGRDDRVDPTGGAAAGPADRVGSGRPTVGAGTGPAARRGHHDTGVSDAPPVSGKTTRRAGRTGLRVARDVRPPPPPSPPPAPPAPRRLRGQRAFHTKNGHLVIGRRRHRPPVRRRRLR